jgi:geranylgeranyl pyrophosphate synthase
MILVSLRLGAAIAQAGPEQREALATYGRCLGLAFQITDDLLDVRGDEPTMGKRVRKDSVHGKLTYPALLGLDGSVQRARQLIEEACNAIQPLGPNGASLEALARYVLERDR